MSVLMTCKEKENTTSWSYINDMKGLKTHLKKDIYSLADMHHILYKIKEFLNKKNIEENKQKREELYIFALKSYFNKMNRHKKGLEGFCRYYETISFSKDVQDKFCKKEIDKLLKSKKVYSSSSENFLLFLLERGFVPHKNIFTKQYIKNFNYFFKSEKISVKWKVDLNNKNFMECLVYFLEEKKIKGCQVRDIVKTMHVFNLMTNNKLIDFVLKNDVIVSNEFYKWCERNLKLYSYKKNNKDILSLSVSHMSYNLFNTLKKKRYSSNVVW